MNSWRQGDVWIETYDGAWPEQAEIKKDGILAHGEATGHAHRLEDLTAGLLVERDGTLYLRVTAPTRIVHEEHAAISLTPGTFRVIRQREYTPEAIRNVAD